MVNQPSPYDPNYGQQPQQPGPEYGQQQPAPDYGQQQPPPDYGQPQQPAYGPPPPGGQLPPPAYPVPQAGFTPPAPHLGPPRKPGAVGGLMALLLVMAGLTLGGIILTIIDYIDYGSYRYPENSLFSLTWYFGVGLDVVLLLCLILSGVMVAGGKDGARVFGAFAAGAAFPGAISAAFGLALNYFEYGHATFLGVLAFLVNLLLTAAAIVVILLAVGKPVSRWFAQKVLGRTA